MARLDAVCEQDGTVRLRSLTDVDWDRVSLFHEGTPPEEYEAETGNKMPYWAAAGTRTPEIMVLQKDGVVIQITQFAPQRLWRNMETKAVSYDSDVLVSMAASDSHCSGELVLGTAD